jgi:imidazolonepropionase
VPIDLLVRNASEVVTVAGGSRAPLRGAAMRDLQRIDNGAVAIKDGKIAAVGRRAEIEAEVAPSPETTIVDAGGGIVVPGLIEPHTHLLFAGSRVDEFHMRVAGAGYLEIAARGGGIARTVAATRSLSAGDLAAIGRRHLDLVLGQGTTTVEIKSGYGLSTDAELAQLRVLRRLSEECPNTIVATFLGAHAIPPEFRGRRQDYVDLVADEMVPAVARERLAEFCDVFCEEGAFTVEESRRILAGAARHGLAAKVHADELSLSGGARLASEIGACSADHLNFTSPGEASSLVARGTIAVLLPATPFFLLAPRYADGRGLIDLGVPVALATDFNPTSSISSMLFVMFLACLHMRFDPSEALAAATINAAHAIRRADRAGSIEPGKLADLLVLAVASHREIPFYVGRNIVRTVIKSGKVVAGPPDPRG